MGAAGLSTVVGGSFSEGSQHILKNDATLHT